MDAAYTQRLASYLPRRLLARLAGVDRAPAQPWEERFSAAILMADISGFTNLSEQLAQRGAVGAEQLSEALNAYFGRLVEILETYGGDVVRFAGDAPIVLFARSEANDGLAQAARRAACCALELQRALHDYEVAPNLRLSMRIQLAAGDFVAAAIGGVDGRWEYLVDGQPLAALARLAALGDPGQVLLSLPAFQLLGEDGMGTSFGSAAVRLEGLRREVERVATASIRPDNLHVAALAPFVPRSVLQRVDAGDTMWFAESRRVTVAFVKLTGMGVECSGWLASLQAAFVEVQKAVYRYEGSINQFLVDDKGMTVLALWGIASRTHEDDPARAVRALLGIEEALDKLGIECAGGVTTSRVYCGHRGSARRREYAVIGASVNLAARLATKAAELPSTRRSNTEMVLSPSAVS